MNKIEKIGKRFDDAVDFFQDWLLPTNPASKNAVLKPIGKSLMGYTMRVSEPSLKGRVLLADAMNVFHAALTAAWTGMYLYNDENILQSKFFIEQTIFNGLPMLVQFRIRRRVKDVLQRRYTKKQQALLEDHEDA